MNTIAQTAAKNSPITIDNQIPFIPINIGSINTVIIWKTAVLDVEIIAEISPLFNAVKNDEPKILKPANKNPNE